MKLCCECKTYVGNQRLHVIAKVDSLCAQNAYQSRRRIGTNNNSNGLMQPGGTNTFALVRW